MTKNILSKSVTDIAPLIQNKDLSPVELTKTTLDHAEVCEEKINATMEFYRKEAIAYAKKAEQEIMSGNYRGLFHGVPMAIKDNIFIENKRTTMSSKIHKDYVSTYDATVVKKVKEAGAILTGKLNMHEYAMGITNNNPHYGAVRNPWDLTKVSGGSSGGSAAALAADTTFASIGTDTAGSIRLPSALCGTVGLKPTRGRVSLHGIFPLSWTLDHAGPMTKTVKDAAALLEIIAGYDENDPISKDVSMNSFVNTLTGDVNELVIGIEEDFFFNHIDTRIERLIRQAIETLVSQGAKVEIIKIPALTDGEAVGYHMSLSEASMVHYNSILTRLEDFGEDVRGMLGSGASPASKDYLLSANIRELAIKQFNDAFQKVDVIIAPTTPVMPNKIGEDLVDLNGEKVDFLSQMIRLTSPGNYTGLPSLSVPCGLIDEMPVGLQIIGPAFKEDVVLNVGYAIEQTNPLQGKKPKLV